MKRAIVLSVRQSVDTKSGENKCWVTLGVMPSKMLNSGNIFYPKTTDILVSTCAGEISSPDKFKKYKNLKLGDVMDISYGVNERSNQIFVDNLQMVKETPYALNELIV